MGKRDALPNELVHLKEAARIIGCAPATLVQYAKEGLLTSCIRGRHRVFRRDEIHQLLATYGKRKRNLTIHELRSVALQALATARIAETRVTRLMEHLGLDAPALERDETAIRSLYADAQKGASAEHLRNIDWVRFWGGVFFSIDENYLELVEMATGDKEPWKMFIDFGNQAVRMMHEETDVPEGLRLSYKYLEAGVRNLRHAGFMYCFRKHGRRVATAVFDGTTTAVDEIMALLH